MPNPGYERRCTECQGSLKGRRPGTVTCSDSCRSKRSRRLAKREAEVPAAQELAQVLNGEFRDQARDVIQRELAPVVREAMTEEVLRSINQLVGLTPSAVAAIAEDIGNEDPTIRQRAYTLLLKYTVGHPAVIQPKDADPNQQMVVNFNLPRPNAEVVYDVEADDFVVENVELRTCDVCAKQATTDEFVGASDRCKECFAKREAEVRARFGND